jgi:hypothetical protein
MEGFLEKQSSGALGKRWQRRFFVISGHYLNYYAVGVVWGGVACGVGMAKHFE